MRTGDTVKLGVPHAEAVEKTKEAFKAHGFGTLTEIDVRATLEEKLGEEMEDYTILGVCNPGLAHRALDADRAIGLLLPCTVVVRAADGGALVEALDPTVMVTMSGDDNLRPVADEAAQGINAALADLAG